MAVTVVVDMQSGFGSSKGCLDGTLQLLEKSMQRKSTIVVVELNPREFGPTLEPITSLVKGYKKLLTTTKVGNDGSREVQKVLTDYGKAKLDVIRMCGVNAEYCVKATTVGLAEWYRESKIILHYEATCSHSGEMHATLDEALQDGFSWFKHTIPQNLLLSKNDRIINFNKQNKKKAA